LNERLCLRDQGIAFFDPCHDTPQPPQLQQSNDTESSHRSGAC
jgi:hypothetical protein